MKDTELLSCSPLFCDLAARWAGSESDRGDVWTAVDGTATDSVSGVPLTAAEIFPELVEA
ncbi:MAG: hypothetical protein RBT76_01555 [candidate division Zixibacteria bacterium]|jgi:hypothetical protein|nr:hypothetical protein [candidate division Zixibacteria bacterium]